MVGLILHNRRSKDQKRRRAQEQPEYPDDIGHFFIHWPKRIETVPPIIMKRSFVPGDEGFRSEIPSE
jgi:hypothetical protein